MACYKPLECWEAFERSSNGRKQIYFGARRRPSDSPMTVKCGQCIGCRLDRSREWAIRCSHEAQFHEHNSFLTLTYANDPVTLDHRDFQNFMKRLRKAIEYPIAFYMCGEYGSVYDKMRQPIPGALGRPHFHCLVFGHAFPDRVFYRKSPSGIDLYNSDLLDRTWKHGYATVQDFSIEAAAYVARYCTKKINGDLAEDHYTKIDGETGEIIKVAPEYNRMSLRPAIGKRWVEKYHGDVYPKDFITNQGIVFRPPRYYDKFMEGLLPEDMAAIKDRRAEHAKSKKLTRQRLEDMERFKKAQTSKLIRTLE